MPSKLIRSVLLLIPMLSVCTAFAQFRTKQEKGYFNITTPIEFKIGRSAAAAAGARFAPVACYGDLRVTWRALAATEVATLFNTSTH